MTSETYEALAQVRRVESWAREHLTGAALRELCDQLACLCRAAGLAAEYAHTSLAPLDGGDVPGARAILSTHGRHLTLGLTTGRTGTAVSALSGALSLVEGLVHPASVGPVPSAGESGGAR